MKKLYIDPEFELVKLKLKNQLLAVSDSPQTGEGDVGIDHAAEVVGCPDVPEPDVVVAVDELEDLDGGVLLDLDVEELREVGAVLVLGGLIAALDLPGEVLLSGEVLPRIR